MKKKLFIILVCFSLLVGMFAGCAASGATETNDATETQTADQIASDQPSSDQTATEQAEAEPVTLKILKAESADAEKWAALAEEYHAQNPNVTIEVESYDNDYWTVLKTRLNAGEYPDIFVTTPFQDTVTYQEYCLDLTGEPFLDDLSEAGTAGAVLDGKVLGVNLYTQAYGIVYNKAMFAEAGITETPKTLSELEDACQKLEAIGVTPFSNGYKEFWVIKHCLTNYMGAEDGDAAEIAKGLSDGSVKFEDLSLTSQFFDFIDLSVKYGTPKTLESGYVEQVNDLGSGKVAMIDQGTWVEGGVLEIDPDLQLGFFPVPVLEDASKSKLMAGAYWTYRVAKDGKNIEESKKFLDWLITSDYGKAFGPDVLNMNTTIIGNKSASTQLYAEAQVYADNGEINPLVQFYWPSGFEQQLGAAYQKYIAGESTKEECLAELDDQWAKLAAAVS